MTASSLAVLSSRVRRKAIFFAATNHNYVALNLSSAAAYFSQFGTLEHIFHAKDAVSFKPQKWGLVIYTFNSNLIAVPKSVLEAGDPIAKALAAGTSISIDHVPLHLKPGVVTLRPDRSLHKSVHHCHFRGFLHEDRNP